METALITGGAGFIGTHLCEKLRALGVDVIVLDKSIHRAPILKGERLTMIEGNILSQELVEDCLKKVDVCFHLAAFSSLELSSRDWMFSHQNNVVGFNTVLDMAAKQTHRVKIIYASSSAVYGNSQTIPLTEDLKTYPISCYGADKLSNEIYAQALFSMKGLPSIGLRFFNVFGKGQSEINPYTGVISKFKQAMEQDKPLVIYGDGQQTRDFIYIDDIVEALILCAKRDLKSAEVFNVCTGEAASIQTLATTMTAIYGAPNRVEHHPPRVCDIRHSQGSPVAFEKATGYKVEYTLEQGLRAFLAPPANVM